MAVTILSIIQVLIGVVLIVFVLGQSGKHSGLGMISGTSDSFPRTRANPATPN